VPLCPASFLSAYFKLRLICEPQNLTLPLSFVLQLPQFAGAMAQLQVHPFYRLWFTWIDPLTLLLTSTTCFLDPAAALELIVPAEVSAFVPAQATLLHQTGILYLFVGTMFAVLLRASTDLKVWRIMQAATLGVDVALIATMFVSLETQRRLELGKWRGMDFVNLGFTVWVASIRTAYLTGVGGGRQGRANKRK
jgi:hypothetical protein